jgi:hypothetical protein
MKVVTLFPVPASFLYLYFDILYLQFEV